MILYSPVMPIPPKICLASRAIFSAISTLFRFAMEIWAEVALSSFLSAPKRQASSWALVISVIISANFFC